MNYAGKNANMPGKLISSQFHGHVSSKVLGWFLLMKDFLGGLKIFGRERGDGKNF